MRLEKSDGGGAAGAHVDGASSLVLPLGDLQEQLGSN